MNNSNHHYHMIIIIQVLTNYSKVFQDMHLNVLLQTIIQQHSDANVVPFSCRPRACGHVIFLGAKVLPIVVQGEGCACSWRF
jgi:hypothetical protein